MAQHSANSLQQPKAPQSSSHSQQIATAMGDHYGVDTTSLKATHNSSFPATVGAEATIQGNQIHFGPGHATEHNIKHAAGHAIDNAINGTPVGDQVVQGQRVDTTREKVVERMACIPIVQPMQLPVAHHLSTSLDRQSTGIEIL